MDSHVLLYRAKDRVEASLLQHFLESSGVAVDLAGGNSTLLFGEVGAAEALLTDLWVRRDDLGRGRELLEQHLRARAEPASDLWRCEDCGETNEAGFALCWNCRARAPRA